MTLEELRRQLEGGAAPAPPPPPAAPQAAGPMTLEALRGTLTAPPAQALPAPPQAQAPAPQAPQAPSRGGIGTTLNALGTGIVQGATLGFGDELRGLTQGALRSRFGGEDFQAARAAATEQARRGQADLRRQAPVASFGGELLGGAALPLGPLSSARTALGAAGRGLVAGGVLGAASGAGNAQGPLPERAEAAAVGGVLGAGTGAVLGLVTKAAGDLIAGTVSKRAAGEQGRRVLEEAVRSENLTPDALAREIAKRNAAGVQGVGLADVAQPGGPVQRQLSDVLQNPNRMQGPLREQIATRQAGKTGDLGQQIGGQVTRLVDSLDEAAKTGGNRWYQQSQALAQSRKAAAAPLFSAAEAVDVSSDPGVVQAFQRVADSSIGEDAIRTARRLWANEYGKKTPFPLDDPANLTAVPNMRVLKVMKEALDDEVTRLFANERTQNLGRSGAAIRDQFRDALVTANPRYAEALKQYAGDKAMEEALEAGRRYFQGDAGEQVAIFQSLSPAEQEQFRIGAITSQTSKLRSKRSGPTTDFTAALDTPDARDRIAAILPSDEARRQFFARLQGETAFSSTARAASGSQTTPLAEAARNVERGALPEAPKVPSSLTVIDLARLALQGTAEKARARQVSNRRGAIGEAFARTDSDAQRLLDELFKRRLTVPDVATGGAVGAGAYGAGLLGAGITGNGGR